MTEPDFRMKKDAGALAALVQEMREQQPEKHTFELVVEQNWQTALQKLQQLTGETDLGVVTGTLYLIADVRSRILYNSDSEKGW
ncbi:hypothetical protein D3C85_1788960 [compost metagenome]